MKSLLNQFKELDFSQLLKVNGGYSGSSGGGSSSSGNTHASYSFGGSSGASVTITRGYSSSSSGSGGGHTNVASGTVKGSSQPSGTKKSMVCDTHVSSILASAFGSAGVYVKNTSSSATKSYAVTCASSYSQRQPEVFKDINPAVESKNSLPLIF